MSFNNKNLIFLSPFCKEHLNHFFRLYFLVILKFRRNKKLLNEVLNEMVLLKLYSSSNSCIWMLNSITLIDKHILSFSRIRVKQNLNLNSNTYFHNFPNDLLSSEFCRFGYCFDMTRRAAWAQTMNAFIGLFMCSFFFSVGNLEWRKMRSEKP